MPQSREPFRDPAEPLFEQRMNELEKGEGIFPTITGTQLAPNALGRRLVWASTGVLTAAEATGTYYFLKSGAVMNKGTPTVAEYTTAPDLFRVLGTQWAVTGRTAKMILVLSTLVNAKAPGSTFIAGLYKLEKSQGATGKNAVKYEAVLASSVTNANTAPAAEATNETLSAEFAIPATGFYSMGVEVSVEALKAESQVLFSASLFVVYT